jgi:LCP family protein required for cell wall assembly
MKRVAVWFIAGVVALALTAAMLGWWALYRPLGPALALEGVDPTPQEAARSSLLQPLVAIVAPNPQAQTTPAACGQTGSITFLLLGLTSTPDQVQRGADAIRLVRADFDQNALTVLALPPDLWVRTLGMDDTTLTHAYWRAQQAAGEDNPDAVATEVLAQAIFDNFAFRPQHYLTVNQEAFAEVVDTLGGIKVDVPVRVDGSMDGHGVFEAGEQFLSGERARDYVRILQPGGAPPDEWGRFNRQNQVLQASLETALRPDNWSKAPELIAEYSEMVVTDMSLKQLIDLGCLMEMAGPSAALVQVEPSMLETDADGHVWPAGQAIANLIAASMGE